MLFTNRRVAYALLWLLNHIPFVKPKFEVQVITIELESEVADWTPEDRMRLADILENE